MAEIQIQTKAGQTVANRKKPGPSGPGTGSIKKPIPDTPHTSEPASSPVRRPVLVPTPVLARVWVEAPFDELAWPSSDIGEKGPRQVEQVEEPWVEDIDGNILTKDRFLDASERRFNELTASSTLERAEQVAVKGVFPSKLGAAVRELSISFGEGGSSPQVSLSGTSQGTRRKPLMRIVRSIINLKTTSKQITRFNLGLPRNV